MVLPIRNAQFRVFEYDIVVMPTSLSSHYAHLISDHYYYARVPLVVHDTIR